jgi:hypothetical protein
VDTGSPQDDATTQRECKPAKRMRARKENARTQREYVE